MAIGFASPVESKAEKKSSKAHKFVKAGTEEYRAIEDGLLLGLSPSSIAKEHDVTVRLVRAIKRRLERFAHEAVSEERIKLLTDKSFAAMLRGTEDPAFYNCAKVGATHLKGVGIYRTGDDGKTPATQNNFFLMGMTPEQADRVIQLAERARNHSALPPGDQDRGIDPSKAIDLVADQERPALVAAECHENL